MKKSLILLPMAAVLLTLTGCKKDNEKSVTPGETVTLSATLGGGEKTEINGFDMKWSDGDAVNINGTPYTAKFALGYETAIFENVKSADQYEAYYPAGLYQSGKYVLPATQEYAGNKLSSVNPMYAVTTTKTLQFNHICALVKLQVTGTGTVKTITVTSSKPLSGAFEIVDNHAVIISKDAASLTLKCDNENEEGVELSNDVNNPTIFYIAVPQNDYNDLQFTLSDGTNTWSPTSPTVKLLEAGKLYTKSLENVEFKKPAVFSVSATTTVEFAPGNLQATWNGGGYTWAFAENQYDYVGNAAGNTTIDNQTTVGKKVDLFGWTAANKYTDGIKQYGINTSTTDSDYGSASDDVCCNWGSLIGAGWRTLSRDEWNYLLSINPNVFGQQEGHGRVNALSLSKWSAVTFGVSGPTVSGLIIMPDGYDFSTTPLTDGAGTTSYERWQALEASGAVFLPAAGYRYGSVVYYVGSSGYYWSSTPCEDLEDGAYGLNFRSGSVYAGNDFRYSGYAVRLVR